MYHYLFSYRKTNTLQIKLTSTMHSLQPATVFALLLMV